MSSEIQEMTSEIEVAQNGVTPEPATLLRKMRMLMDSPEFVAGFTFPDTNDKGMPLATQANIFTLFERFEILLAYDDFALRTHVFGVPGHDYLDDDAFDDIYVACDFLGLRVGKDYLWSVLKSYARNLRKHLVKERLATLQANWDGIERLDTWLPDYCGADDTPYTRAVGAKWMIGAVRRVREPGSKFDTILIFEGEQGSFKSSVFRALAYDEWFTDNMTIGLDPKEVIELTRGKWICELAELTNIAKKDVESVKHFVTRQVDEARMAYTREAKSVPRQFVLAASTNKARYLRDETGDRRFWVVATKGVINGGAPGLPAKLDVEGIIAIRDQLWAEAAHREAAGELTYLDPEVEALAKIEQAKRFDLDDRQQYLEDLLCAVEGFVPTDEVYRALGVSSVKDRQAAISKLVTGAMSRLGWTAGRKYIGSSPSRQVRGFSSPDAPADKVLFWTDTRGFAGTHRTVYGIGAPI
ncbi:MAG: virulence-associated E family protein [Hyphomicrobiaceae bacterium]|nr:virulence-associated E family protein [Hyphomicrobiaceae bacterium]